MNTTREYRFYSISPGLVLTFNEKNKNSDGIWIKETIIYWRHIHDRQPASNVLAYRSSDNTAAIRYSELEMHIQLIDNLRNRTLLVHIESIHTSNVIRLTQLPMMVAIVASWSLKPLDFSRYVGYKSWMCHYGLAPRIFIPDAPTCEPWGKKLNPA